MNPQCESHLNSELLQAFAEGVLDSARMEPARAHLAECGRCRAELEGWELVFSELEDLPDLGPALGFADRVMTQVEVRPPLSRRLADRFRRLSPTRGAPSRIRHLSVRGIHDYLDHELGIRAQRRVEGHLMACGICRSAVAGWAPVFEGLQALPRLSPPEGFADAVMAQIPVATIAETARSTGSSWMTRALSTAGFLIPATRKGWAMVGGLIATPTVALTVAVAAVILHPLISFQGLFVFARWRLADVLGAGWLQAIEAFRGSAVVLGAWDLASSLLQAPGVVAFGLTALWASMLAAVWVLYRHVIAPSLPTENHAKASS